MDNIFAITKKGWKYFKENSSHTNSKIVILQMLSYYPMSIEEIYLDVRGDLYVRPNENLKSLNGVNIDNIISSMEKEGLIKDISDSKLAQSEELEIKKYGILYTGINLEGSGLVVSATSEDEAIAKAKVIIEKHPHKKRVGRVVGAFPI